MQKEGFVSFWIGKINLSDSDNFVRAKGKENARNSPGVATSNKASNTNKMMR